MAYLAEVAEELVCERPHGFDLGLGPLERCALLDRLGREVVEEVGGEVEVGAVATVLRGRDRAAIDPVLSHHSPAVSPGTGIIALTNTSMLT